jgi:hypothetical protein
MEEWLASRRGVEMLGSFCSALYYWPDPFLALSGMRKGGGEGGRKHGRYAEMIKWMLVYNVNGLLFSHTDLT